MFVGFCFFCNISSIINPPAQGKAGCGLARSFYVPLCANVDPGSQISTPVLTPICWASLRSLPPSFLLLVCLSWLRCFRFSRPYDVPARAFSRRKGKLKEAGGRWAEGSNESVAEFVKREREQVGGRVGSGNVKNVYMCTVTLLVVSRQESVL